jgi:hypothetical protein
MPATPSDAPTLRIGARVLLLDQDDHVLLIHAKDPTNPIITGGNCPAAAPIPARPYPTLPALLADALTGELRQPLFLHH